MPDYNVDGFKEIGIFYVFARYIFPVIIGIALIALAVWAFYYFGLNMQYLQGSGLLLLLILILMIA